MKLRRGPVECRFGCCRALASSPDAALFQGLLSDPAFHMDNEMLRMLKDRGEVCGLHSAWTRDATRVRNVLCKVP